MCGIVGANSTQDVTEILLAGLQRLEYRGYDSAGIAVLDSKNHYQRQRTVGKVSNLVAKLKSNSVAGNIGIAHTRWATHGVPCEENAHPHLVLNEIAIVHNGIIENHEALREELINQNCIFTSTTDSELIAHLIYLALLEKKNFLVAVQTAVNQLRGAYAIAVLSRSNPDELIVVRQGSPLVIGLTALGNFIASDPLALSAITQKFIYLAEGDTAVINKAAIKIIARNGDEVSRPIKTEDFKQVLNSKGEYPHYMLKEIFEQPSAIAATMTQAISEQKLLPNSFGENSDAIFAKIQRVQIVACGTSYHAALIGKAWLEEIAGLPCLVEIASEYRYRVRATEPNTLFVTLSQSGETADTLAALKAAQSNQDYLATLAICNVATSSLVRESDLVFITRAGPEIGVASTKAFTTQLTGLFLLALTLHKIKNITAADSQKLLNNLLLLPEKIQQTLLLAQSINQLAHPLSTKQHAIFIGRGTAFPIALEGALKLKEISYIHAEAYPAGELKHGPLALVDENMPIIALGPNDAILEKLKSNLQEIISRMGKIILFTDLAADVKASAQLEILLVPEVDALLAPILYVVPLQLLAYYTALHKGTDVDQPRNLAKSVTVE
jgi:glucosamine--fructose-6-phosphate aminotransferase (isomerizing)